MIILEGPDGTGKTELAKRIADQYALEYLRYSGLSSTKGPTDQGIVAWWDDHLRRETMAVFDRCFYISEPIYQLAMPKRPLILSGKQMDAGIQDLISAQPMIIFCLPLWEKTWPIVTSEREKLDGVDLQTLEKIHWQYECWYSLYDQVLPSVLKWNFHMATENDAARLITAVGNYVRRRLGPE